MTESTPNEQNFNPRLHGEVILIEKALADDEFKQALLSDPKATIEAEFNINLPDELTLQVVEAQADHLYICLPAKPEIADTISVEELTQLLSSSEDEFVAPLIARAWKDEEFKQQLLNEPKTALTQQFGTELPDTLTVEVLEETATHVVMIVPFDESAVVEQLSTEELEAVAGGNIVPTQVSFGNMVIKAPSMPSTISSISNPGILSSSTTTETSSGGLSTNSSSSGTKIINGVAVNQTFYRDGKPISESELTAEEKAMNALSNQYIGMDIQESFSNVRTQPTDKGLTYSNNTRDVSSSALKTKAPW